jgi:hypothetical protein
MQSRDYVGMTDALRDPFKDAGAVGNRFGLASSAPIWP